MAWTAVLAAALILGSQLSASAITVSRTSAPYLEINPELEAEDADGHLGGAFSNYAAYQIRNDDAVPHANLWVRATGFQGSFSLSGSDSGEFELGSLAVGETKTAFFYVRASEEKEVPSAHSIQVFNGRPGSGTAIATTSFALTSSEIGHGNNNRVTRTKLTPANPVPGDTVTVEVDGETGVLKSGDSMIFSPAVNESWNARAFRLVSSIVTVTNGSSTYTYKDTLFFGQPGGQKAVTYHAVYTFKAAAETSSVTHLRTAGFFATGGSRAREHAAEALLQLPAVRSQANATTVSVTAGNPEPYTGESVTYTARFDNAGATAVTLNSIANTLPSGFVHVSGSTSFAGTSIADPSVSGDVLTWSQGYAVPAGGHADLVFRAVPATAGLAINRTIAYAGSTLIDSTLATDDVSPASIQIRVLALPVANPDEATAVEDTLLTVAAPGLLGNDLELNGYALSVTGFTQPLHGLVSVGADGSFAYQPEADYSGTDSFTYTLSNGHGRTATATASITVTAVNDVPALDSIRDITLTAVAGPHSLQLAGIGSGSIAESGQTLILQAVSSNPSIVLNPSVLYTSPQSTGTLILQPAGHAIGTAIITVTVLDDGGTANGGIDSFSRSFLVQVTPGPVSATQSSVSASGASVTADGSSTGSITVTLRDANGNLIPGAGVALVKTSGPGAPSIQPAELTTDAQGVATFSVQSTTAGTVRFGAVSVADATAVVQSAEITFIPGPPAKLTFGGQPSSTVAGQGMSGEVTVIVRDRFENVVTDATTVVALHSASTSFAGGPLSVGVVAGVASFPNLVPLVAGESHVLLADGGSLPTATSLPFDVSKATPVISGVTSHSQTYGTPTITLAGSVGAPGPVYPADGETVAVTILGVTQMATISGGHGQFSVDITTATLPFSPTPHPVTYAYAGDSNLKASADDTSTGLEITRASLVITAGSAQKTYGDLYPNTGAGQTFFTASTLPNGEWVGSVTISANGGAEANAAVGTYSLTPSLATGGFFDPANYSITYLDGTLSVLRAPLSITANPATKAFGQTYSGVGAGLTAFTPSGLKNGEIIGSVTLAANGGTAANSPVGTYSLTPSAATGGNFDATNYELTYLTGTLTVQPAAIQLAGAAPYNGTTTFDASGLTVLNSLDGSNLSLSGSVGIDSRNVGDHTVVSVDQLVLGGSAAGNYSLAGFTGSVTLSKTNLTVTAVTNTKIYDGTTAADAIPTVTEGNLQAGDSATWTETYAGPHAGTGILLTPAGVIEDGNGGANYQVTFVASADGIINLRPVSVTGLNAVNLRKFYDGTAALRFVGVPTLIPADIVKGDDLFLASYDLSTARFADFNVDDVVALIFEAGFVLGGSDAHNYYVVAQFPSASAILSTKTDPGVTTITHSNPRSFDLHLLDGVVLASNNPDDGSINGNGTIYVSHQAVLGGSGRVGSVVVADGGVLSPGDSPGTIQSTSATLASGGIYDWQLNNARGTAGANPGWDLMDVTGSIDIQATSASPFIIHLNTLNSAGTGPGLADNFDPTHTYAWPIATAGTSIIGFSADKFSLVTTDFQNSWIGQGTFSLVQYGNSIYVVYSPNCVDTTVGLQFVTGDGGATTGVHMLYTNYSGIISAQGLTMVNVTITCTPYDEANHVIGAPLTITTLSSTTLPPGTAKADLLATKTDLGQPGRVNTFVLNHCGTELRADPIIATLEVDANGALKQALDSVPAAEHYYRIVNGDPGLERLEVTINGRLALRHVLRAGDVLEGDFASYLDAGDANIVTISAYGAAGATAQLVLADTAEGTLLGQSATPRLVLGGKAAGHGLRISWQDPSGNWVLQHSTSPAGGWENVGAGDLGQDGLRSVTVSTENPCGFFRLRRAGSASPAAASNVRSPATRSSHESTF